MRLVQEAAQTEKYDSQAEFTDRANDVRLQLLQEYYLQKKIDEALTDEALNAEYEKLKAAFEPVEQVHARHILVEKEEDAKKLIEELKAGGDFVELAKEHSTGPSGKDGGDLGFFIKEAMVPEFADAAFAMEVGTYSEEPVKTQFGWHVIKVEGRKPTEISPFEELKDEISDTLTNETVTNLLESLKAAATIEVVEAEVAEPALEADDKAEEKPAEAAPADEKPADEGAETPKTEDKKDG
nr:peptidylprolyl isomerase [Sneathiella chinensis]